MHREPGVARVFQQRAQALIGFVDTYLFAIAKDYANQAAASIEAQATE